MRNSNHLKVALNSYVDIGPPPLRQHIVDDLMIGTESHQLEQQMLLGSRLIDRTNQYISGLENLKHALIHRDVSIPDAYLYHKYLNTGMERRSIYPEGSRTSLSASVEVITAAITIATYLVAAALIALIGKLFLFMTKGLFNSFRKVNKSVKTLKKITASGGNNINLVASMKSVTVDSDTWPHFDKIPAFAKGKSSKFNATEGAIAAAVLKEWVLPEVKPFAVMYLANPSLYKQVTKEVFKTTKHILEAADKLKVIGQSLQSAIKGRKGDVQQNAQQVIEINQLAARINLASDKLKADKDKYEGADKLPPIAKIGGIITNWDFSTPNEVLDATTNLDQLKSRLASVDKALKNNEGELSSEDSDAIKNGLTSANKMVAALGKQTKLIELVYTHNGALIKKYTDYLNIMSSTT